MIARYAVTVLTILFSFIATSANAQLEQIQMVPGTPDYIDAVSQGGHPIAFPNGDIGIVYKIQTDYSVNDFGPDRLYLIRSTDGGATWSTPVELDFSDDHQGLCCMGTAVNSNGRAIILYFNNGSWRLRYSDDSGATWTPSATPPNMGDGVMDLAAGVGGAFVGTYQQNGSFFVITSADGLVWSSSSQITNGGNLCGGTVAATSETRFVFIYEECWFNRGDPRPLLMATSDDGGATWSAASEILTSGASFGRRGDLAYSGGGTLWLIHTDGEDLAYTSSQDGGATWAASMPWTDNTGTGPRPGDFDQDFAHNLAIFNDQPFTVFLARRGNDWFHIFYGVPGVSADPLITSVEQISGEVPTHFQLGQNFPNPFNPSTNIKFSLPNEDYVRLTVFDLLGKEIARLADAEFAAGEYKVSWDASGLPSGTYMYTLVTGAGSQTRMMVFLK